MTQSADRLAYLFQQYVTGACTKAEADEFFAYAADPAWKEELDALAYRYMEELPLPAEMPAIDWDYMYGRIVQPEAIVKPYRSRPWRRLAVAAAVLLVLTAGAWWWWSTPQPDLPPQVAYKVMPGGDRALLTLADGTVIPLDSAANGTLAQQGGVKILKLDSGRLAYSADPGNASAATSYNTLATPRGGQFRVTLPDGSRVWLNAASSIRYPTVFTGRERKVELTGEAYFEVESNSSMPFKVALQGGGEVLVLGTHFNINAYADEELQKTTLLEGAVSIAAGGQHKTLRPGQQAQMEPGNAAAGITVRETDVEAVVAWKNGYFQFNQADIRAVMRQIARWYDVEISYEGRVRDRKFWGDISRDAGIADVLKVLETSGVHFRIEGKKIVVTP